MANLKRMSLSRIAGNMNLFQAASREVVAGLYAAILYGLMLCHILPIHSQDEHAEQHNAEG